MGSDDIVLIFCYDKHGLAAEQEASILGIVFCPTLLRTSEGLVSLDTVHQTKVIELLIEHVDSIFGPPLEPSSSSVVVVAATALPNSSSSSPALWSAQSPKAELEWFSSSSSSLLSKVPIVRPISFLEIRRRTRPPATPADRRSHVGPELREEVLLPGFVADKTPNNSLDIEPPVG